LADELYSHKGLEKILNEFFGDEAFGACLTKIVVTSYDIQNRESLFLKNWQEGCRSILMRHVARATSAAPTYFEPALIPISGAIKALVDGGVFINSPAVSAYAEAKNFFQGENDFFVLSLGTGELIRPISYSEAKGWGKAGWVLPLLGCMFDGMADAVNYQMKTFLGERYVRLQTDLSIASDDMDNITASNIAALKLEAEKLIRTHRRELDLVCTLLAS
jgi:predicted acylesterase/phospholipase RssA